MRPMPRHALLAMLAGVVAFSTAPAQSRQPWSVQGSGLYTAQDLGGSAGVVGGGGVELQGRRTFAAWSLGLGVQYSTHSSGPDELGLTGFFAEPRYVLPVGSAAFAPYLAGRVAFLRGSLTSDAVNGEGSSNGLAFGAGGGVIFPITRRVNIDVGGAVLRQSLSNITLDDANALEVSFPSFFGYVVKAGLSIGF